MSKPEWENEMEDFFGNMTDEDFRRFLEETGYDFYMNVKTPLTGVPELDALEEDAPVALADSLLDGCPGDDLGCGPAIPLELDYRIS